MWDVPVVTESAANNAALLCTVYDGTHYLDMNPIAYTQAPEGSIPQKDGAYEFHNFRVLEEDSTNCLPTRATPKQYFEAPAWV